MMRYAASNAWRTSQQRARALATPPPDISLQSRRVLIMLRLFCRFHEAHFAARAFLDMYRDTRARLMML